MNTVNHSGANLLSIVTPTYNRSHWLHDLYKTIIDQQYPNIQWVIVDNCSTDNTAEVVSQWQAIPNPSISITYEFISVRSAQIARNIGIQLSVGDYIVFVDSDDTLSVDGLYALMNILLSDALLDYAFGQVQPTNESLDPCSFKPVGHPLSGSCTQVAEYNWHTMGAIYKKALVHKAGYWRECLSGSQDWEFQSRIKMISSHAVYVPVIVGYWRQHMLNKVGSNRFRKDYILSVLKAIKLIRINSSKYSCSNPSLSIYLAKRALLHAIECGANKSQVLKLACINSAKSESKGIFRISVLALVLQFLPNWIHSRIFSWYSTFKIKLAP